jgi:hypothetical protein
MLNESTRTMSFLGAAALSALLAFFFAPGSPRPLNDFGDVGKSFYPDFDVATAKSLTVDSFSDNALEPKTFQVEQKNGKWGILLDARRETYYPADGEDRLAKTAASVIDIKREQFVTKDPEQYATFQVVDPLEKDMTKLLGRGRRVTIKDADSTVLADYIIGKKVPKRETDGEQVYYYVRRPDEKNVYTARLNIDLSTKFSDWIESDLLKLQGDNLVEILSHKYTLAVNQQTGRAQLKGEESNILTRDKPNDPWKLQGLDDVKEEVNQDEVKTMTSGLDDLKIIGARAKPEQLTADLKASRKLEIDESIFRDLMSKGFFLMPDDNFLSSEGEVEAITDAGIKYTFRFGNAFTASEIEIETGLEPEKKKGADEGEPKKDSSGTTKGRYVFITTEFVAQGLGPKPTPPVKQVIKKPEEPKVEDSKPAEPKKDAPAPEVKPEDKKPAEGKPEDKKAEDKKPEVKKPEEPKAAEPKAEEPKKEEAAKPEAKPAEEKPAEEKKPEEKKCGEDPAPQADAPKADAPAAAKSEEAKPAETKPAEAKPAESKPADAKAVDTKPADAPTEKNAEPAKETAAPPAAPRAPVVKPAAPTGPTPEQQAEANFKQEQAKYEQDLKAYDAKVEAGKKKVKELNGRFAQWYYVISDENFQKMRLARKGLVKPKTKTDPAGGNATPSLLPGVKLPGGILPPDLNLEPDFDTAPPKGEKPAAETKPAGEKPAEAKPAAEKPAAEKPATDKPEAEKKPEAPADKPAAEKPAEEKLATEKPAEAKPE